MTLERNISYRVASYLGPPLVFAAVEPLLGPFQQVLVTEIMIWCIFAIAYNLLFGYTGLTSLGHALFFGAGMYAFAYSIMYLKTSVLAAILLTFISACLFSILIGLIAVRVKGVYFLIITLVLSMAFYSAALNYPEISGGSDGLVLRMPDLNLFGFKFSILDPTVNYYLVWIFLTLSHISLTFLTTSPFGTVLKGIRENEQRARLVGYDVHSYRLLAFTISGTFSGLAGSMYALSFRFAGPQLMTITASVNVLVWTLVGGAATILGPLIGTIVTVLVVDYISSETTGFLIFVGLLLVLVTKFAPRGIVGTIRDRLIASSESGHDRNKE
jgi:branched-chain amino acid transport system permease protein